MSIPIEHQIIKKNGVPLFVVVPYDEYISGIQKQKKKDKKIYFPQEVVEKTAVEGKSIIRAWREHKRLSQKEVAEKMGITQAAYCQLEKKPVKLRSVTLKKIATALDVSTEDLTL